MIRIAVTGPESTGKSTLTSQLAEYFNTIWVPEYAREYLSNLKRAYNEHDLLEIAKGQVKLENKYISSSKKLIFYDTELLVIKIWSEHKYNRVHPWILSRCREIEYDLYLLTTTDITWEEDPQRENPERGAYFFSLFKQELEDKNSDYGIISGKGEQRLLKAIELIENKFHDALN